MSFKATRLSAAALVTFLLIQMQLAEYGYASRRTKIAFTSTRDGNGEIYVMDGDGRNLRRVTVNPARDWFPTWSPDGNKIAFLSNRKNANKDHQQIWVIDADGRNRTQLTHDLVHKRLPSWSHDGKRIAYVGDNVIWVVDSGGDNPRQLTKMNSDEHATWSPDSESIAFHSFQRGLGIYVVDVTSGAVDILLRDPDFGNYDPDWLYPGGLSVSPEGSRITIWGRLKRFASGLR